MSSGILQELASHLEARAESIIDEWWMRVCRDEDLRAVATLTREEFKDNIVSVIADLAALLREDVLEENSAKDVAIHGENRWRQSFSLQELVRDWGHLNSIFVDEFACFFADQKASEEVRREASRRLAQFAGTSMSVSVGEYERLRQYEAASLFQDLKRLRQRDQDMIEHRARALREYAHDMRGSLAALAGAGNVMASQSLAPEHLERLADMIDSGVRAISGMLETLLELSRLEAGLEEVQYQTLRVQELMEDLDRLLRPMAERKSLELVIEGDSELTVETDPHKLRRILQNLLVNAVKYTKKGSITLRWGRGERHRWCIWVTDTGPGLQMDMGSFIAQQTAEPEFDRNAADVVREGDDSEAWTGEGIGLSIVKRLCEMLDILIELESEPGKGTCFTLRAPIDYSYKRTAEARRGD